MVCRQNLSDSLETSSSELLEALAKEVPVQPGFGSGTTLGTTMCVFRRS